MKNFDSRTYSINDFFEWQKNKQLILNPKFQRRSVWTDTARSYLMDTIVRGKPIPKVFIRQQLDTVSKTSIREVVDGQQRLRTILSYLNDGFSILKRHNSAFGGVKFSQLSSDDQANVLNYELATDLLVNMPDAEVLDVFGRLNSYAVVLNQQERLHATHFGPFKSLTDQLAHHLNAFWTSNRILSDQQVLRMQDVTTVADLVVAMLDGIRSKKQLKQYYGTYEANFPFDTEQVKARFLRVIEDIQNIFRDGLKGTEFRRVHIFYSLFTAQFHLRYGLKGDEFAGDTAKEMPTFEDLFARYKHIDALFQVKDVRDLDKSDAQFLDDSRRATTDAKVRIRRTKHLVAVALAAR